MFDFDATLPVMALQFLVLAAILNAVFFKPLNKALDDRDEFLLRNDKEAKEKIAKAKELAKQFEQQLGQARRKSQEIIAAAQADAKKIAEEKIAQAQREAQARKEEEAREIEKQKEEAMRSLEQQVDTLSRQILEKILGPELVK
jgi:F-type H+-transporting ATPase subunit b